MNERDFAYWLQGFFEMTESETLTKEQVGMIKEHLELVFEKKTGSKEILKEEEENDNKTSLFKSPKKIDQLGEKLYRQLPTFMSC